MKKIAIFHQHFYPDISGSSLRLTEVACGLAENGWDVRVYTAGHSSELPKREIYYRVTICRISRIRFDKNQAPGRMLDSLVFFISAFFHMLFLGKKTSLYIGSDPGFLCFLGCCARLLKQQPYLLHIADLYPDMAVEMGYIKRKGLLHRVWNWVNRVSFQNARAMITLGEDMKQRILTYLPFPHQSPPVHIIRNWENEALIQPVEKQHNWFAKNYGLECKTVVLYSGNLGVAHDLWSVLECAEKLRDETRIVFLFVGDGAQKSRLISRAREQELPNVRFLPYQPIEHISCSLSSGDIQLITMKPGTEGLCVPGKFYTALASESAIIALVPENTEIAKTIQQFECGISILPADAQKLAEVILDFHRHPEKLFRYKKKSRQVFEEHFTRERALREYAELFKSLAC